MLLELTGTADPALARFQVLGERSSGTNFVSALIKRNTPLAPSGVLGWKHGFPHMLAIPADLLVVAVVRAPIPWLLSMYTRPWHCPASMQALGFSDFLRAPWDTRVDRADFFGLEKGAPELGRPLQYDRDPLSGEMFANILKLRSAKLRGVIGLRARSERVVLVALETVLADPEGFLDALARRYGLIRRAELRTFSRKMGHRFRPAVQERPEAPKVLDPVDLAFVRDELDPELESRLGYGA